LQNSISLSIFSFHFHFSAEKSESFHSIFIPTPDLHSLKTIIYRKNSLLSKTLILIGFIGFFRSSILSGCFFGAVLDQQKLSLATYFNLFWWVIHRRLTTGPHRETKIWTFSLHSFSFLKLPSPSSVIYHLNITKYMVQSNHSKVMTSVR
jgi:hypothetical protein